nr:cytochrome P450 82C4-like [Ipomoea batatas]
MDIFTYFSSIFALVALLLLSLSWRRARKSSRSAPEAGGAWPIVGHLHLLRAPVPLVKTLSALADKHGPVFMIRLGKPRALVVSNWEAVKDCFATNDKLLAARPTTTQGKYLGYDYAVFSFSTYNSYWRKVRKLAVVELLSSRRLEKLKHVWVTELQANIKELNINPSKNKVINMSQWFEHLTLNLIVKVVAGRRYEYRSDGVVDKEAECMKKVFKEVMFLWGEVVSGDAIFPLWFFRWLDYEGHVKTMKRVAKALDAILQDWVDARKRENGNGKNEDQGFIDVMLSMIDDQFLEGQTYTRDTIIKATVLSMLQDGSETFSVHFTWITHLAVARLVQGFNFNTPSNEALDMSEGLGITMPRANPLEVVITPRLPSSLY